MKQIIAALLKAQSEMGNAVKNGTNPHFKSKFADLNSVREAVIPLLNENGIIVLQPMVTVDGAEYVKTVLLHESGETIESHTKIVCKSQNDPQALGSAITYARRYGLQSLVCIGAEDDDGNRAANVDKGELQKAIDQMKKATSRDEVTAIWNYYSKFQSNADFLNATKEVGNKYPKK
jgi:hypothetical protein